MDTSLLHLQHHPAQAALDLFWCSKHSVKVSFLCGSLPGPGGYRNVQEMHMLENNAQCIITRGRTFSDVLAWESCLVPSRMPPVKGALRTGESPRGATGVRDGKAGMRHEKVREGEERLPHPLGGPWGRGGCRPRPARS